MDAEREAAAAPWRLLNVANLAPPSHAGCNSGHGEAPRTRRRHCRLRRLHPAHDQAQCGEQAGGGHQPRRGPAAMAAGSPGHQRARAAAAAQPALAAAAAAVPVAGALAAAASDAATAAAAAAAAVTIAAAAQPASQPILASTVAALEPALVDSSPRRCWCRDRCGPLRHLPPLCICKGQACIWNG